MSLIPLALGARAITNSGGAPPETFVVNTRMREKPLLLEALTKLGAKYRGIGVGEDLIVEIAELRIGFDRDSGDQLRCHANLAADRESVNEVVEAIESEYCTLVAERTRKQIKSRVPESGMKLVEEHIEDDGTVVLTLEVNE